ncbi:MAG: hypothetical protein KI786_13940 [Mameliella sp.]|nr:hypothetical protein [Phaeodactylibacter sp.]
MLRSIFSKGSLPVKYAFFLTGQKAANSNPTNIIAIKLMLEQFGLMDNTIVVFSSDTGARQVPQRWGEKATLKTKIEPLPSVQKQST